MKKLLLSTLCLAAITSGAQVIYSEDFEGADPLASMTLYGTDGATVATDATLNATGLVGETMWVVGDLPGSNSAMTTSWFSPVVVADNYMITPSIALGVDAGYRLSWSAESLGSASYLDPYTVKLSTTGTAKADFTTTLFTNGDGAPNVDGENIEIIIPAEFSGENVHIAFIATGEDDYILTFDNIKVEQLDANDIELVSLEIGEYVIVGDVTIAGTVRNNGSNPISSFTVNWNDGTDHSEVFTETILTGETYDFSHATTFEAVMGTEYSFEVCATVADDELTANDCISKSVNTALDEADRLPLIELFTSSTCPPCYTLNYLGFDGAGLNAGLEANNANDQTTAELAVIKYQVNWPGDGDHAHNADVTARVSNYSIGAAPTVVFEGNVTPTGSFNSSITDAGKEVGAYVEIIATHSTTDGVITVDVDVNPFIDITGAKLHIALLDKEYEAGAGASFSNGETEFHHVLRKMLPSASGTTTGALTAGEPYSTSQNYDYNFFNGYPAQGSFDLHASSTQEVVVFLQATDGTVLNSVISTGHVTSVEENNATFEFAVYPNPASQQTVVALNTIETATISIEIFNILGELVYSSTEANMPAGKFNKTIDVTEYSTGIYSVNTTVNGVVRTEKLSVK